MSIVNLVPLTIGVFEGLHVFTLNNFNIFSMYVFYDIEIPAIINAHSTPRYFPS